LKKDVDIGQLQLAPPPPGIFEVGVAYDSFWGAPRRHLAVRFAYGVFEAAWELSADDALRVHAVARTHKDSEDKLLKHLTDRVKK